MSDRQQLCFCFPYRGPGGVSLLFSRFASALAKQGAADCTLVDYSDGFMARNRGDDVAFISYSDEQPVPLPPATLIFQSMTPWSIFPKLRPSSESPVLFWNCHPLNLVPMPFGVRSLMQKSPGAARFLLATLLRPYRTKMRRLVDMMLATDSLVFMDQANVKTTEHYLGISVSAPVFVPVATTDAEPRPGWNCGGERPLEVAWVGRIADFKYPVLTRTLTELARAQRSIGRTIRMTIVGSGDFDAQLRADVERLDMAVAIVPELTPAEVDLLLREKIDLLVAMGTSALEGAKFGVPTILLDIAYRPVDESYHYQWFYNRTGLTLGDVVGAENFGHAGSLVQRLTELLENSSDVARRTLAYFQRHHALSEIAPKLLSAAAAARCRWGDLQEAKLTERGFWYNSMIIVRKKIASL